MTDDTKVEVDAEAITKDITDKVTAEITPQIREQILTEVTPKIKEEASTAARQSLIDKIVGEQEVPTTPWDKEKRNPKSYTEVAEHGAKLAEERILAKMTEKEKEAVKKAEDLTKQGEQASADQNKRWNEQMTHLVEKGELPALDDKIQAKLDKGETLTAEERKDPGVQARADLYTKARDLKEPNLELVYYRDMKGTTMSGASAPVFGTHRASQPTDKTDFTYESIHNEPIEKILAEK